MADRELVTRTGKAASLSGSDYDQNVNSMNGTVEEITAATHTIAVTDQGKTIQYNRGTAIAVTIPTAATIKAAMDTSVDNFKIRVKNIGAGVVTITSTDNIDGALTLALNQWDSVLVQTNTANDSWQILGRDMDVVDINGGTVDGAVIGGTTAAAITGTTIKADTSLELATGETVTGIEKVSTNSDAQLITSSGMEAYADAAIATAVAARVAYYEITNGTNLAISGSSSLPTVVGSLGSINIPTKGRITIFPDQIRIDQGANPSIPTIGLQIGSTEYYIQYNNDGATSNSPAFNAMSSSETDIYAGTFGDQTGGSGAISMSIVGSGISTGTQTVSLVMYNASGNANTTIAGALLTTTITVIVESFL